MKKTQFFPSLFASPFVLAALFAAAVSASAQGGAPPTFVPVPFISLFAGGAASNCAGAITVDLNNYGDGCQATKIKLTSGSATIYSTAADKWGNVYYSTTPNAGIVQVIYAGPAMVNGTDTNPATAMIPAANPAVTSAPVAGDVYTVAGGLTAAPTSCSNGATLLSGGSGSGCSGTGSYLKKAYGVAVDGDGNVFILDESNSNVYVLIANASSLGAQLAALEYANAATPATITPAVGSIYLLASTGGGYSDGVFAIKGKVHNPYGIAVDAQDNVYIADYTDDAVRMINGPAYSTSSPWGLGGSYAAGYIHTIAGDCTSSSCTALAGAPGSNEPAVSTQTYSAFVDPAGIAVDAWGNVYVGDNTNAVAVPSTVRAIYAGGANNPLARLIGIETGNSSPTAGYVYTLAGDTVNGGSSAKGNGLLGTNSGVSFDRPYGLAVDKLGNIYVADYSSKGLVVELDAANGYLYFIQGEQASGTLGSGDFCNGNSNGPTMTDAYGDGCPATQSSADHYYGNPSFDAEGNMYLADSGDGLIRKLTFTSFPATAVGSTSAAQKLAFTLLTGSSSEAASNVAVSASVQGANNGEFADAGTGDTCTGSTILTGFPGTSTGVTTSSTAAYTCVVPITFKPSKAGLRAGAVQISATINGATVTSPAYVSGVGQGQALVIDPSAAATIGSGTAPQGVATDAAGNTYIAWSNGTLSSTPAGPLLTPAAEANGNLHQIAVDGAGDVYVADSGNNQIDELAAGASSFTAAVSAVDGVDLSGPLGVAVDGSGNLYIADTGNKRVLFVPVSGEPEALASSFTFDVPVAVAVDANGNVYVGDTGLNEIVGIPAGNGTPTVFAGSVDPAGLAVDAAGDVVYADESLKEVVEIPLSGANAVIASGLTSPLGVALDGNGGVYLADTANSGIAYYPRNASTQNFASSSASIAATVSSIGNVAYSGTIGSTDSTDFELTDASGNGCTGTTTLALAAGQNCAYTALFTPAGTGNLSDTITFTDSSSVNGIPTLTLTGYNAAPKVDTTTAISVDTVSPVYGSGVQLTITVAPASGSTAPGGTVTYTVDGGSAVGPESVSSSGASSTYTFSLSGLSAGQHTISATYTPGATDNFNTSSVTNVSFSVAALALTASANSASSIYGQAIPALSGSLSGVLSADNGNVTAVFATTATATSPVGSYPISVTLTGPAAGNYSVTLTGTPMVTITPATVTLAIANAAKTYGAANPTFTGTFTNVLSQDAANLSANYSTTATAASPVGSYPITATALTGSAAGNYELGTVTNGALTVSALAITATANPVSVPYGQAIPAITGTLSGVLAADASNVTAVFSTTATSTSPIGSYPIAVSLTGPAAGNYSVTLTGSASVTVTTAVVTVAVNNTAREYGAANPAFSGTLNGVLAQDAANVTAVYATTATATSSVGSYPITVQSLAGSAAGNYALGAVTPGTLTVTQAATTTSLTTSGASVGSGSPVTFTATVASTTTGTPAGSVVFSSNGSALGSVSLSGGVASYTTSSLPTGPLNITAAYAGSANFSASTSPTVVETVTVPIVTGTTSTPSVSISSGGSATVTVNFTAQGGYVGTASYSCALLPVDMTCSFSPATATFSATSTTASTTVTISTNGQSGSSTALLAPGRPASPGRAPLAALAGIFAGLWMLSRSRRKLRQSIALLILLVAGMAGAGSLTGCGGSATTAHTPAGTYNILVNVTAGTVQSVPLTVTVQ